MKDLNEFILTYSEVNMIIKMLHDKLQTEDLPYQEQIDTAVLRNELIKQTNRHGSNQK